ncbi:MAG: hypothetical protein MH204_00310, partial [Fimbriimonadaceae bacterium]|nr:hypothetical protein [Fimbriimonadaceae bacterium]
APRGRGLPYRMSRLFAKQGWNILGARVSQWAGRGAASFVLTGPGGAPLEAADVFRVLSRGSV